MMMQLSLINIGMNNAPIIIKVIQFGSAIFCVKFHHVVNFFYPKMLFNNKNLKKIIQEKKLQK